MRSVQPNRIFKSPYGLLDPSGSLICAAQHMILQCGLGSVDGPWRHGTPIEVFIRQTRAVFVAVNFTNHDPVAACMATLVCLASNGGPLHALKGLFLQVQGLTLARSIRTVCFSGTQSHGPDALAKQFRFCVGCSSVTILFIGRERKKRERDR